MSVEEIIIDAGPRAASSREILGALRVLSAEQYDAWVQADKIVAEARQTAEAILKLATQKAVDLQTKTKQDAEKYTKDIADKVEKIQTRAQELGYEAGKQAALAEGLKVNAMWRQIAESYKQQLDALASKEQAQIVTYASLLAERIIRTHLEDATVFREHLKNLLQEDSGKPVLMLQVHPDQLDAVKRVSSRFPNLAEAVIEPDRSLDMGDLRLQYAWHKVDGRLQTMLDNGASVLLQEVLVDKGPVKEEAK